mmetsp:Transcript_148330/g.259262  ORF Transcript_148330/g.259262 Transcript_148330/m.259262 type:complete len:82 (+) Transcript_148330:569-814(+)
MGLQEPHLEHLSDLSAFTGFLPSRNISSVCNLSPAGNSGAALLFNGKCEAKDAWSLSPRIMLASLTFRGVPAQFPHCPFSS